MKYDGPMEPVGKMYQIEHNELMQSIRDGKPMNDGVWMAHSTMMAIMGRMSAYSGKQVTWDFALNSKLDLQPPDISFRDLPVDPVAVPGRTPLI